MTLAEFGIVASAHGFDARGSFVQRVYEANLKMYRENDKSNAGTTPYKYLHRSQDG